MQDKLPTIWSNETKRMTQKGCLPPRNGIIGHVGLARAQLMGHLPTLGVGKGIVRHLQFLDAITASEYESRVRQENSLYL